MSHNYAVFLMICLKYMLRKKTHVYTFICYRVINADILTKLTKFTISFMDTVN